MSEDLKTIMGRAGTPAGDCWEAEHELQTARGSLEWATMFLLHIMPAGDERDCLVTPLVTAWVKVEAAEGMVGRACRTLITEADDGS